MTPISPTESRAQGFTLLELLLVLALIALALGLVIPTFSGDRGGFRADLRRAVATLTYARRAAIVEAMPWTAEFHALDPDGPRQATLAQTQALASPASSIWASETLSLQFQNDAQAELEADEIIAITFFPQGGSTGGILTFSRAAQSARVRVDPITGRIAIAYGGEDFDAAF
ncbi:MAG: prepilin-type N-terminal cleavage/methylation domain-containing protein [Pseudomonadales bacterium]|jgi:general secretion pathway protein H|nr:prepilin-type N-terminal cleavage/methylation domain-containing protein [Pseudomonadales bacterium]